ncbi:hypothetical protein Peur_071086 [Populus x canadensis]
MLYCLQGILVVFPQLLFSILDNWSSVLLEHNFCLKSMQVCEWDDMLIFII